MVIAGSLSLSGKTAVASLTSELASQELLEGFAWSQGTASRGLFKETGLAISSQVSETPLLSEVN